MSQNFFPKESQCTKGILFVIANLERGQTLFKAFGRYLNNLIVSLSASYH